MHDACIDAQICMQAEYDFCASFTGVLKVYNSRFFRNVANGVHKLKSCGLGNIYAIYKLSVLNFL